MIGQTISHYRIVEKLGKGGMGVVYRAEDTKLKRTVALKFLPTELTRVEQAKKRFVHEAQAASALDHPNICTIHEIDATEDGRTFIVMACYTGETLEKRVERGALSIDETLRFGIQIASGLARTHQNAIVHRDIKPGNLFITTDNEVKIVDFGIAKLAGRTKITRTGRTVGTISFMSPEQARGGEVDPRSDIFSLGAVLYNMMTGRLPFEAEHEAAVIFKITSEDPIPLSDHRGDVPKALQRVIYRALRKDPRKRYQSADDMLADLRAIQTAIAAGRRAPRVKTGKRRRLLVSVLLACVIVSAAIVAVNRYVLPPPAVEPTAGVMIAVLPFKNLGPSADEYFADGVTEAITARLAGVRGLGVISRQSAIQFKDSQMSLRQIGADLGVTYILDGTIQRERPSDPSSRVRVIPQLVRVDNDTRVWTAIYDEEMAELFHVQSMIAEQVATALDVRLIGDDRRAIAEQYTDNIEAYEYYLRGRDHTAVLYDENVHIAEKMFKKAIDLDDEFALAWAGLSMVRSWLYFSLSQKHQLEPAREAAQRALDIDSDLPEAHMALGFFYYRCLRDHREALKHLSAAQRLRPSDDHVIQTLAHVHRREGNWETALQLYRRSQRLNPRAFMTCFGLGQTYRYLREYDKAETMLTRAIALSPRTSIGYLDVELLYISWDGNTKRAARVLEDAIRMVGPTNLPGRYYSAVTRILYSKSKDVTEQLDAVRLGVHEDDAIDYYFNKAVILEQTGRVERSLAYYDSLRAELERTADSEKAMDPFLESFLGLAYAKLGRVDDAIKHGQNGADGLPISKDAVLGPYLAAMLAAIYTELREHDRAIDILEQLLIVPGDLSVNLLEIDPIWDPLRVKPRFQKLLTKS
ncbi:MAG: protein kinase [Candidatus Latescibacterota bacterium]|nr:MAG: protein kinase [Candidatus Latescibacterota bacterium]